MHIETEELIADALEARARGFTGSKIKIGRPHLSEDRERLTAVREAVGPSYEIMVDANQSFTLAEAKRRARMLQDLDIAWFEEPMPADNISEHRLLAASTPVPISVGESLYSIGQFKDYLVSGGASVIQVDVARVGGITPWMKVAHMAEAFNVPVCPHFLMELHASLVCAIPNAPWLEYILQLDTVTKSGLRIENGRAWANDAPGLGIDWDLEAIEAVKTDGLDFAIP